MFVIPCKYNEKSNIIGLITKIKELYHDEKILVCDSFSDDKSYLEKLNTEIILENKNYVDSAVWSAYENYPDENYFYVLHDSMVLHKKLPKEDFVSYMYFTGAYDNYIQEEYVRKSLSDMNITHKNNGEFIGLFGITFSCKREILDKLYNKGLNKILPSNKNEMCGSERIWGIVLKEIGIDITKHSIVGKYMVNPISDVLSKFLLLRK